MSVTLSDEKNDLIKQVAKSQGFHDYELKVTSGSTKGDGYLGIINTAEIQDKNKPDKSLHLIIKSASIEEKLREQNPIKKAYEREIYLYTTVFSEFEKISEEVGISNRFTETAKCFGSLLTNNQECLALQNLKQLDFKLWDRKVAMNEEHVALVVTTYAKFHATGVVLKLLKPEKYQEISKNLVNIFDKENETEADLIEQAKPVFENGFRAVANNPKATEALTKFSQESGQFFDKDLRNLDKFSTILHGDCWCNNMMFKYEDDKNPLKPTRMCLLDWQISFVGSPILDLSYFFYANSSKEVLYNFENFLKIYYDTFVTTIKDAGITEDFSYEELKQQWKFYSRYGLFMTLFIMKVLLSDSEEAPDLSELAKGGKDILFLASGSTKHADEIDKRIYDVIVFMNEHDFL